VRTSEQSVRIAVAQLTSNVGTATTDPKDANLPRLLEAMEEAAANDVRLVAAGELYLTGLRTDEHARRWAVTPDQTDPTIAALTNACARHNLHLVVGTAVADERLYNSALVLGPGGVLGRYDKTHLATYRSDDGLEVDESALYTPGDALPVFDTPLGRVGIHICYDLGSPEVARTQALAGADLLINVTASQVGFEAVWQHLAFARAFENSTWYVIASVVGTQQGETYFGGSAVLNPIGEPIAGPVTHTEELLLADLDLSETARTRTMTGFLRNRRPDTYNL